jgi:Ni/Co efflux regulator RcnB
LISILLASAAASPALAQDQDGHGRWRHEQSDRAQAREERAQAREERQQAREEHVGGGGNFERAQPRPEPQSEPRQQQVQGGGFDRPRFERPEPQQVVEQQSDPAPRSFGGHWNRDTSGPAVGQQSDPTPRQSFERRGRWNRDDGPTRTDDSATTQRGGLGGEGRWSRRDGDLRQSDRPVPSVMQTRNPLIVSTTPREGTQPPVRSDAFRRNMAQWNTNWRYNHRYDWRSWRDRHRSTFRVGVYYDPFGWNYRPYQIGWRLWPSYYSSRYWIDDPWDYRLPYAPPGYVWVRYWDDAILVDRWSGEVVDVIHNFFW